MDVDSQDVTEEAEAARPAADTEADAQPGAEILDATGFIQ